MLREDEVQSSIVSEDESKLTRQQIECLTEFRRWIETEAEFYGRTDDEYLLLFLRACKFDLEKAKKKLTVYYGNRRKLPSWWANRNLRADNIQSIIQLKIITILIDDDPAKPCMAILRANRFGPNMNNFDDYAKVFGVIMEIGMRRPNCQSNGNILIMDCRDYPLWFVARLMWPALARNLAYSYFLAIPMRIKKIIALSTPTIGIAFYNLVKPFLPRKLKQRVHIYGSDWSKMYDHVDVNWLPEEYGGNAGPLEQHDEACLREVQSYADYFEDDNKYGFR